MSSISADFTSQQYLEILSIDLISTDCIKSLSEIVYETYNEERQLHTDEHKYINYLREIKNMLKNINERMKNYDGGMEFNDLSGSVNVFRTGIPMRIDTYSDIFYYRMYKYVRETLDGTWDDLDIKEILVGAFNYYISITGKLKGEHNIEELTNAFRECIESAAERANLYSQKGWFTGNEEDYEADEDDEARGGAAKYTSSRRKYNPSRSKASRSKASRSKASRSKASRSKASRSKARRSKARRSKAGRNKHQKSNYDKSKDNKSKPKKSKP